MSGPGIAILAGFAIWLGFAGLLHLPNDWSSIRAAGLSLDWWYGAVIAPLLIIVLLCRPEAVEDPEPPIEARIFE